MTRPKPRIKFTVADYMTTPDDKRFELLDGELVLAPSPTTRHQRILSGLYLALEDFVASGQLGQVFFAPIDVLLDDTDVVQPDLLFVSNARSAIITEANIQGAPDLVVEVLSPSTGARDRGYKQTLYAAHGVAEYWLVDPEAERVEVLTAGDQGLSPAGSYGRGEALASPLLEGLEVSIDGVFGR